MASTIKTLLITVLAATLANAGFSAWSDDNFPSRSSSFHFVQPPPFPALPGLPPLPPLMFPNFAGANFPNFQSPNNKVPSIQGILNLPAQPGSNFNSVAVISQSQGTRGPDGQIQKDGQATVLINDNGHVTIEKHDLNGGGATVILAQSSNKNPSFSDYKTPEFKSSHFKMPKFEPITMKPFHMKPFTMKPFVFKPIPTIDPATIRDYVPQKGEKFTGSSYRVQTHFSDVNGVKKRGGSSSSVLNNNGYVEAEDLVFSDNPK